MDISRLAQALTYVLARYLPYLWHDNRGAGLIDPRQTSARELWAVLRPALDERPSAFEAVRAAADEPGETTFLRLRHELTMLLEGNTPLARDLEQILDAGPFQYLLDPDRVPGQGNPAARSAPAAQPTFTLADVDHMRCQVCGRQDETLRIVAFPYVASVIFMTFRRTFSGIWCGRHATLYNMLAALITSTVGWIGIPFGFVFSPIALFDLARGGNQPTEANRQMLLVLAQHKTNQNDQAAAIRCLESALLLGEDQTVRARLEDLYRSQTAPAPRSGLAQIGWFLVPLLAAVPIGWVPGIVDSLINVMLRVLGISNFTIIGLILLWMPLVSLGVIAALILSRILGSVLNRTGTSDTTLGLTLAVLASLTATYNIATGSYLGEALAAPASYFGGGGLIGFLWSVGWSLFLGGEAILEYYLTEEQSVGLIYMLLVVGVGMVFLIATTSQARAATSWRARLDDISQSVSGLSPAAPQSGWISLFGALIGSLVIAFVFIIFPAPGAYGDPEAFDHFFAGSEALGMGDAIQAESEYNAALSIDSQFSPGYLGLSFVALDRYDCTLAHQHLETARQYSFPQLLPVIDDSVGRAYFCEYELDLAQQYFEQSLQADPNQPIVHVDLATLAAAQGDYSASMRHVQEAVALDSSSSYNFAVRAALNLIIGDEDQAASDIQRAEENLAEDVQDYLAVASYYITVHEYDRAMDVLNHATAINPDSRDLNIYRAEFFGMLGWHENALELINVVVSRFPDSVDALQARSDIHMYRTDLDLALQDTEAVLELAPNLASSHAALSFIYYQMGRAAEAEAAARDAIDLYPNDTSALVVLSLLAFDKGDMAAAAQAAERAIELSPRYDTAHYAYGIALVELGRTDEAVVELDTFYKLYTERPYSREYIDRAMQLLSELR